MRLIDERGVPDLDPEPSDTALCNDDDAQRTENQMNGGCAFLMQEKKVYVTPQNRSNPPNFIIENRTASWQPLLLAMASPPPVPYPLSIS